MNSQQSIGIFDSGVGGLTVAHAVKLLLPNENLIYFGDTAHLPYGDKSSETIQFYSKHIVDFLLSKDCKAIIIACNTASATAYEVVRNFVNEKAIVVNVIDPVVEYVTNKSYKNIGVIGTKGTINSKAYLHKIQKANSNIHVNSLATPLFVPMIEEGFIFDDISNAIIRSYLSEEQFKGIESLILGCTHYPIIKNQISKFFDFKTDIVDSARVVANYVRDILSDKQLLNTNIGGKNKFYVSDYTDYFKKISKMFFEEEIELEKVEIWQ